MNTKKRKSDQRGGKLQRYNRGSPKWTESHQQNAKSEKDRLLNLERDSQTYGYQETAVEAVSDAIRRSRSGLQDQNAPLGVFILRNHRYRKDRIYQSTCRGPLTTKTVLHA